MFDHLTTDEILAHMVRLERALGEPLSMRNTLEDVALHNREYRALEAELSRRND